MTIDKNLLADSYDAAADYIEQHGWLQGQLYPFGGSLHEIARARTEKPRACAMGAGFAVGVQPERCIIEVDAIVKPSGPFSQINMREWTDILYSEIGEDIPGWNDEPGRIKEDIIELFRMTALKIRMGNIGDNPREYEFEPMPTTEPVTEPAAPQPVEEPVPA